MTPDEKAARTSAAFALIRRLDVEMDNDEWLELFERVRALTLGLPLMEGYGLVDAEGGLLLACTTAEQARKIQMVLLLGGTVTTMTGRGPHPLLDFCHPESAPEALTARLLAAIEAEFDEEGECDCDECAQALADDDDDPDACDCDDGRCEDCDDYNERLDAALRGDECACPCAKCEAGDHENCTGTPAPPTRPQKPPSKRFLN